MLAYDNLALPAGRKRAGESGGEGGHSRLTPAVERVIGRTGEARTVTADRGYGEAGVDDDLHDLVPETSSLVAVANPA
jgi:IS5 family transposase